MDPELPPSFQPAGRPPWRRPLVWLLVACALALALILLAPTIGQALGPGQAQSWFSRHHQGSVRFGQVSLSWTGRQRLDEVLLLDPDGDRVARFTVELPSLIDLARGGGRRLGKLAVELEADLRADDQGVTNLDRALAARESASGEEATGESSGGGGLEGLDLELELTAPRITWSDATTRALGQPLSIEDLRGRAVLRPGQPIVLDLEGGILGKPDGRLRAHATLNHLETANPSLEVDADLAGLPSALIDALARQDGLVRALLGPELALRARGSGTLEAGGLELTLVSERTRLEFRGALEDGVLRGRASEPVLALEQQLAPDLATVLQARFLPAGTELSVDDPSADPATGSVLAARVSDLRLDLRALLEGARRGESALPALATAAAELELSLAGLALAHPALAVIGPARLERGTWTLSLGAGPASSGAARVASTCALRGSAGRPGDPLPVGFRVDLRVPELEPAALARLDGALGRIELQAELEGLTPERAQALGVPAPHASRLAGARRIELRGLLDVGARGEAPAEGLASWLARLDGTLRLALQPPEGPPAADSLGAVSVALDLARAGDRAGPVATLALRASIGTAADPGLTCTAALEDWPARWPPDWGSPADLPAAEASLELAHLEVALLEELAEQPGGLRPYLGAQVASLRIAVRSSAGVHAFEFGLEADGPGGARAGEPGLRAAGALEYDGQARRARVTAERGALELHAATAAVTALLPPELVERVQLAPGSIALALRSLDLPLAPLLDRAPLLDPFAGGPAGSPAAPDWLALLSGAAAQLELRVAGAQGTGAVATLPALGLGLAGATARIAIEPSSGKSALQAQLDGTLAGGGKLLARFSAEDAAQLPQFIRTQHLDAVAFELEAEELPTALFERWAGPDLAAKIGERLELATQATLALAGTELSGQLAFTLAAGERRTSVAGTVRASEPFAARAGLPPARAELEVTGLELVAQLLPPERASELRELLGDTLQLKLENRARSAEATDVSLSLEGLRVKLAAAGTLEDGLLRCQGDDRLELALTATPALLQTYVGSSLPPGAALRLESGQVPAELSVTEVEFPIDFLVGAAPASLESAVERGRAHAVLRLPALVYTHPPGAGSAAPGAGTEVSLRSARAEFVLAPEAGAQASLVAQIGSDPPGALDCSARSADPSAWVSTDAARRRLASVDVSARAQGLPTALIDALAAQEGLLVDVLGNESEFSFEGQWPATTGLTATFRSPQAQLDLRANLDQGVLLATAGQGLEAELPLSPLFSKRVVGSLVPLLVQVSKPPGARPVGVTVREFSLPLDGDLRRLDAQVVLDLNDIVYSLLPELDGLLGLAARGAGGSRAANLAPIVLSIEQGVCRYDDLPLSIDGRKLALRGTIDLATRRYALTTRIPLAALGSKIEKELGRARGLLDPETLVPLEITGTWDQPRVRVSKDFLDELLKKAAGDALRKGLEDLLGGKQDD